MSAKINGMIVAFEILEEIMKVIILFIFIIYSSFLICEPREIVIEDFESGYVEFLSYQDEDIEPDSYSFDMNNTASGDSQYSLLLYGNTWKLEEIDPYQVNENDVWQIDAYVENTAEIQGFGVTDGTNTLFYSFEGTELLNIEEWVPVYQGVFPIQEWNSYLMPIADDWFAWYEYYPQITGLIFLNDADTNTGSVYFDDLIDISDDLPIAPELVLYYLVGDEYRDSRNKRSIDVQFYSMVIDPDSAEHDFFWDFGDGETSNEEDPMHTYFVQDDHVYTVLLQVMDDTQTWGYGSCQIEIEAGETSFPLTMNFVGDIMLARGMENLISSNGIESIFDPTIPYLNDAADISVANLECPLTNSNQHHPTKTIYFKGDPEYAEGLSYAGIEIVSLANNHVYDYLLPGIEETQAALDSFGILYSGAGVNSYEAYQPVFYDQSGVNTAFLFSSDRTGQYNNYQPYLQAGFNKPGFAYMTPYYITQQIEAVQDVADLIVVETHSGSEYSTAPGANYDLAEIFAGWDPKDFAEDEDFTPRADIPHMWDIEIRHHMIDSGADIVICHHPHVIQGVEIYNRKLIAHSLGDFIFDLNYAETFPSMILNTKIDETGFYEYTLTPIFVDDYIPVPATGEFGLHILDYIAMRSKELNTYLDVNRETCVATVITDTTTMYERTYRHFLDASLQEEDGYFVSEPVFLPRAGCLSRINHITPYGEYEVRLGRESIWFGNFEEEGSTEWNVNSEDEWLDNTESYEGDWSLCLQRASTAPENVITNLENRFKKVSENGYSIHGYLKTLNSSDVSIQARYYTNRSGGSHIGLQDLDQAIVGDTDWTYYYRNLNVPEDANYFNVNANCEPAEEGTTTVWFDNVGLIEWSEWIPINYVSYNVINPNDYYYLQIRTTDQLEEITVDLNETNYNEHLVESDENNVPATASAVLYQNYPNPFNPETTISFSLNEETKVDLSVFNIKGQKVRTLVKETVPSGHWHATWKGKNENNKSVASGVYFFQLKAGNSIIDNRKCLLLK